MSLPANTTYTINNNTVYVIEPSLADIVEAVRQKCISAGRNDLIPPTVTLKVNDETFVSGGLRMSDLEDALKALDTTGPADVTIVVGQTTYVRRWSLEEILTAAPSIGC